MEKKAVVWVSTVLYVLIGLAIMASLLAIIRPEIARLKDKFTIDQTVQSLNTLDDAILRAREAPGMKLNYRIRLDKGNLVIDGKNNIIYWQANSNYYYGGANKTIEVGKIKVFSTPYTNLWNTTLTLDYTGYNINMTVNDKSEPPKTLTPAGLPYSIWIENKGLQASGMQQIDFTVE